MFEIPLPVGPNPLNPTPTLAAATKEPAERTARHLAMLRRIGELGMHILEHVAIEAKQPPSPQTSPDAKRPDPVLAFSRITKCLRDTMALEARLAAGKLPAAPRAETATTSDPRRPAVKNFIIDLIESSPHPKSIKAGFRNQLETLITENLEADAEQDLPAGAIILDICEELGLQCSTSQMPDELLIRPLRPYTQAEKDSVANEVYRRIHGHDPP